MKRALAALLVAMLVFTSFSAMAESTFTPAETYDPGMRSFNGGEVTVTMSEGESGGQVTTDIFAGETGKDYTDEKYYTYNTAMTAMGGGLDWNPQTWETSDDSLIITYINPGFYDFKLNANKDGYSVMPEMAAALPVDVTAEYVGSFGVAEGEDAKAWRIALNPNAVWDNGEKITADDYIYSMQQQLNPKMLNRRADSFYDGDFSIVNAKNYLYAGQVAYSVLGDGNAADLLAAGEDVYVDMHGFWGLAGALDAEGNEAPQYVSVNDEVLYRDLAVEDETADEAWVSAKYIYETYLADGAPYASYAPDYLATASVMEGASWDEVGLKKVDDYTIDIILEKRVAEASFYVPYNLSSNWLVYKPLYESCKMFFDADGAAVATEEEAATVTTNYCTSLDTSIGYGPYKLTYFELDKQFTLERNDAWYGYADGRHVGQYQTDKIVYTVIAEQATRLLAFLAGELDDVGLVAADMEKYASSEYIRYEPQSYTTKISFNTMYDKLLEHGTNSQVVVIDEFRQAFAFALNREEFATAYTAAGSAGYGMLNYQYVYNPFTGALYRDSEPAKDALVTLYGVEYGEGKEYATLDEAYDAMTGYDIAKAQALMATAYDKAVAAGIYDGTSEIEIEFRVYNSDTIYVQMFTYLDTQIKEAIKGSGFEGKLSLKMTVDPDYYETMYSGGADMIFTTWGGAAMSPFTMLAQVYTDAADGSGNQMEVGYDTTMIDMTLTVDGAEITDTLRNWTLWANNADVEVLDAAIGKFADLSYESRCAFVAKMELCFLSYYTTTPLYYRNVASLDSQKINNAVSTYLQLVQFGGISYLTYNYDDAEWADYIANNTLEY
ncbi:MAG TPA: ABC transporter substrate-binding protein [Candidatus Limiplasma sp.]|nr:ABC transporter substrate-binding protein [Candidatus Limiplasma sp.]